ncbi:MAG: malonic semialdehyde reductase [Betaproteobacteria bacterium]|nr:malonic semialdehyde reductase [Betaproteobacteria bacterium]OGA34293.1 MAG: malonic semialdehyde reductase [Betaproteobacteria bacterium RIFCSPLOWO2_12_FULL_64_23]
MTLSPEDMDLIFRNARSQNGWQAKRVGDAQLRALYELMKWAPTTMNTGPARILFLRSREAKERLKPALSPGNVDKTMAAPVTAIIAYDTEFYELLPQLFPHDQNARGIFAGEENKAHTETTAFRNGSMQGGYFIIAARAIGLDCGPMSGFDNAKVDAEFFGGTGIKSNFLCNIGYGDPAKVMPRSPRLAFDEACKLL